MAYVYKHKGVDKLLALLGEGTRSEIKAMVRAGRVTVDGAGARDAGMQVDGAQSDVRLDGRRLCYKAVRHVMLNKPSGVLTAARDKKQKTVMDLLPPMYAAMGAMPAGRLDKDTEGLLVITSDGQLAHRIISPRHEVGKVYYARLDGELTDADVAALEAGIHIRDADGEFDAPLGESTGAAVIFGATGGVMEAALRTAAYVLTGENPNPDAFSEVRTGPGLREATYTVAGIPVRCAVVSGLGNARKLIERLKEGKVQYDFVEVMACPGGCVGGGGQPISAEDEELYGVRGERLYTLDAENPMRFAHENPEVQALYHEYLGEPLGETAHHLLHTDHKAWNMCYPVCS